MNPIEKLLLDKIVERLDVEEILQKAPDIPNLNYFVTVEEDVMFYKIQEAKMRYGADEHEHKRHKTMQGLR